jgi:hypothetical protein
VNILDAILFFLPLDFLLLRNDCVAYGAILEYLIFTPTKASGTEAHK